MTSNNLVKQALGWMLYHHLLSVLLNITKKYNPLKKNLILANIPNQD